MSAVTGVSFASSASAVAAPETPGGQPVEQTPEELPLPSEEAVDFLNSLEEDDYKKLLLEDNLVTISDTGKELGVFQVTASQTRHNDRDCILLHANSHGAIDSVPCGTSITAYVSYRLETLEQHHHEYVKLENHPLDRKTFLIKQEEDYIINRVITQGEDVQRTAKTIPAESMKGFVSEGVNLMLQRLLIKKGLPANFQLISLDSDTHLCPVVYKALEKRVQVVEENELDVTGVERTINSLTDLPTTWQSYFTKDGYLTSRVQVGSPVTMRLVKLPPPVEEEEESEKPTFPKKPINIEEDQEMYSKFLDRKAELKDDHTQYMHQHPELKALTADFLQFLLLRKPDDAIAFAADYFAPFAAQMPNSSAYLESAAPTPYPYSRSNSKIQYLAKQT